VNGSYNSTKIGSVGIWTSLWWVPMLMHEYHGDTYFLYKYRLYLFIIYIFPTMNVYNYFIYGVLFVNYYNELRST